MEITDGTLAVIKAAFINGIIDLETFNRIRDKYGF